jgi:putative endonuclease
MTRQYFVYILTNKAGTVVYTGVSNNLVQRVDAHKAREVDGFTKRYNVTSLVYYEVFEDAYTAIAREKQIKAGSRAKKLALINAMNPTWRDLSEDL